VSASLSQCQALAEHAPMRPPPGRFTRSWLRTATTLSTCACRSPTRRRRRSATLRSCRRGRGVACWLRKRAGACACGLLLHACTHALPRRGSRVTGGSDTAHAGAVAGSLACSASARALAQACTHALPGWRHGSQEAGTPRAQARLGDPQEGAALVFNCQMGRGRTTTGMVIAALLQLRRRMPAGAATLPEHALRARPRLAPHPCATCAQLERSSAASAKF